MSPHTFTLASLFTVEAHTLPVPDHTEEGMPGLEWTRCPTCEGEGWIEGSASVWTGRPTARPCTRCHRLGEVLSDAPALPRLELETSLAVAA